MNARIKDDKELHDLLLNMRIELNEMVEDADDKMNEILFERGQIDYHHNSYVNNIIQRLIFISKDIEETLRGVEQ
jgi:hypothetical protein